MCGWLTKNVDFGGGNKMYLFCLFVCLFLLTFVNWWVALADNGSTSMRSFSFCFFFHRSYYILKKLKENILLFFCLLACLLIHVSLVLFLFLTLPGQGWFWWFLDNSGFHRVWIQSSSGMFIFPGWCCGFLCVSFFFWVCSVAKNLNTAITSVLGNDFQLGMLCSWQSASFLLFRNHSFPTLVRFASLHSWELLSHQFSLES